MKANFQTMHHLLSAVLGDFAILSGDVVGPSDSSWQDVAGTCAASLRALASQLDAARDDGKGFPWAGPFPSPFEIVDSVR